MPVTGRRYSLPGRVFRSMCVCWAWLSAACVGQWAMVAEAAAKAPADRPNFVFILGEGHGWASTSIPMDDTAPRDSRSAVCRTPNLERLAAAGMRFANFYAPSPRCTPSRATLLTGISPARLHMTFVGEGRGDTGGADGEQKSIPPRCLVELPTSATTIAEVLKNAGYATAHFGKWHVGRVSPAQHGFDESDGATHNGGPDNVENPHPKELYGMTERGVDFITRQVRAGKPFYLQLSHYAARKGGAASPQAIAMASDLGQGLKERELSELAADIDLDLALGILLKRLDDLGIFENTFVIFTTDHGSPGRNPPFAGGKGTVSEGGLRVPLIICGPNIQPGLCSHVRCVGADLFPTIAELAHANKSVPADLEGGSLVPVMQNRGTRVVARSRDEYVVHFPHYDKDPLGPASALLLGDFKIVRTFEDGKVRLFNIAVDPGERRDLTSELPDKAKELERRLSDYLASVRAQMPVPNPQYDPSTPGPAPTERGNKKRRGSR